MKPIIGVVGTGHIAQFHFRAWQEMQAQVALIGDINESAAQPYCQQSGARYTAKWEDVVADETVNTVAIFMPSALHYPVVKAALENGKNVICEKTLTTSPAESLELGRLAQSKNLILFTSYMKRFFPALVQAKKLMPELGHITSAYCRTYQGVGQDFHTGEVHEAFTPDASGHSMIYHKVGGGILMAGGSHVSDLFLFLLGKPTRIYSRSFERAGFDVDFMHHALLDLQGGGVVHFEANWHGLKKIGFEGGGWDEGFEISGVNGQLIIETPTWDKPYNNAAQLRHYDNHSGNWTDYRFDVVSPFAQAEAHFLAQIEAGEQGNEPDAFSGYRVDYLLDAAARSAKQNAPLDLHFEA